MGRARYRFAGQHRAIWDAADRERRSLLRGHEIREFRRLQPNAARSRYRVGRQNRTHLGIPLPPERSRSCVATGYSVSAAFSPDGTRSSPLRGTTPRASGTPPPAKEIAVPRGHEGCVQSAVFSPDGTRIITTLGNEVAIWRAADSRKSCRPESWKALRPPQPRWRAHRHHFTRQHRAHLGRRHRQRILGSARRR